MQIINVEQLKTMLQKWQEKNYQVYAPFDDEGTVEFMPFNGNDIVLTKNSNIPPKKLLFPQTEELYGYKTKKQEITIIEPELAEDEQIIFGIKPCDLKSIEMLDDVFLTKEYIDPYYKIKRDTTVLISHLCDEACDTCFCTSMGVDPGSAPGADIVFCQEGDKLAFKAQTEKGEKLLEDVSDLLEEGEVSFEKAADFKLSVNIEGLAEKLKDHFENSYWNVACRKCIGCGTCTYLCPTCHCFDINSHTRGDHGIKTRCWDSCMYSEYTLMAGGHNPRPTKKERFRQRFLHKLQYFPERYEKTACVGCGRCLAKCPVMVDITKIIADLREVTGIGENS